MTSYSQWTRSMWYGDIERQYIYLHQQHCKAKPSYKWTPLTKRIRNVDRTLIGFPHFGYIPHMLQLRTWRQHTPQTHLKKRHIHIKKKSIAEQTQCVKTITKSEIWWVSVLPKEGLGKFAAMQWSNPSTHKVAYIQNLASVAPAQSVWIVYANEMQIHHKHNAVTSLMH